MLFDNNSLSGLYTFHRRYQMQIKGKFTSAEVMTDNVESEAISQIMLLCNQPIFKESKIAVMPDVHAGKGCVVGLTIKSPIGCPVIPNIVGVDIGCAVSAHKLSVASLDYAEVDRVIRSVVPSGHSVRKSISSLVDSKLASDIAGITKLMGRKDDFHKYLASIGSLGGGNHFVEIGTDVDGALWLTIHTGSRNFGFSICKFFQKMASEEMATSRKTAIELILHSSPPDLREKLKSELRSSDGYKVPDDLSYLTGKSADDYLDAMEVAKSFSMANHAVIANEIMSGLNCRSTDMIFTNHNFIEITKIHMITRKGAVNASENRRVLIPLNMKEGTLIGVGRGNADWNESSPHGAGRIMSRSKAKSMLSVDKFKADMVGVYSSSIGAGTLDEAPDAYKPSSEILSAIGDTVTITGLISPTYVFKAGSADISKC